MQLYNRKNDKMCTALELATKYQLIELIKIIKEFESYD